jgi:uncharacterized membrane protein
MNLLEDIIYGIAKGIGYRHPIHPILTHLVIGPVLLAFAFAVIGRIFEKPALEKSARPITVFAFVLWFFTFIQGIIDWKRFYGGSLGIFEIRMKLILAGVLFALLLGTMIANRRLKEGSRIPLVLYTLSAAVVVALGFYGGNLVYGNQGKSDSKTGQPAATVTTEADGFKKIVIEGFELDWRVNGPNLDVRMSRSGTGWLGVGFGQTGTMEGSNILIGYVKDGKATVIDSFGNGPNQHLADVELGGTDDVTNVSGSIRDGAIHLAFTIPLTSGDVNDVALTPGESDRVIMAHGPDGAADDSTYHGAGAYAVFSITL